MRVRLLFLASATMFVATGFAQVMTQHAAAAAGAVVGTAAGKVLSNGIDKLLGSAAATGADASKQPVAKPVAAAPPATKPLAAAPNSPGPAGVPDLPASPRPAGRSRSARALAPQYVAGESQRTAAYASRNVLPPPPSTVDFSKFDDGASREDVLTALGVASSHVTIPDEGHFIEIMSWWDGRRRIGTVHLDNGIVVSKDVEVKSDL